MNDVENNDQSAKADAGKLQISLCPTQIVRDVTEVRMFGNAKYKSSDNWKTVEMRRYETGRQLLQAGAVNGYDGTMESTVSKLMYLLGQGYSKDEILAQLNTSIAGEITIPEE
jgi:hypothetical protein